MTIHHATNLELKKLAASKAIEYLLLKNHADFFLGIGTGSTVDCFIDELSKQPTLAKGYVSSSNRTTQLLYKAGLPVLSCDEIDHLRFYVDGADEIDLNGCMIKGGGGALTREKIIAEIADEYLCIATEEKEVQVLGEFPLPIEVIGQAVKEIQSKISSLGKGSVSTKIRNADGKIYFTDNGHPIIDVIGLRIDDPMQLEREINSWPGVVTVGLFARRRADRAFLGSCSGVLTREYN